MRGVVACLLLLLSCFLVPCTTASSASNSVEHPSSWERHFQPNPLVTNAPLVVAATCRDGIVMMATHPKENSTNSANGSKRIFVVDDLGTCLLCAGWKTDGQALARKCRNLARQEAERYGSCGVSELAHETALYMANCAVSNAVRTLNTVGLLCSHDGTHMWLLDATGAYAVRAHALGGGRKQQQSLHAEKEQHNDTTINEALVKMDFSKSSLEECRERLEALLSNQQSQQTSTLLEVAFIEKQDRQQETRRLKRFPFQVLER